MATISAASILTNVAQNIGVPVFSPTTHVTEATAMAWLQQGVEGLSALAKQRLGEDTEFMRYAVLTTVPSFNLVSLPARCFELSAVLWIKSDTEAFLLQRTSATQLEPQSTDIRAWDATPTFRMTGHNIELFPCPDRAYQLAVWYQTEQELATPTSQFLGRGDWSRWLELFVANKCLQRKRRWTDMQATATEKATLEADLFAPARKRNQAGPYRIRDVEHEATGWRYR
jgi:hypothetical protein